MRKYLVWLIILSLLVPIYLSSEPVDGLDYSKNTGLANVDASFHSKYGSSGNFGTSVSCAGDVNGDGYEDFLISAPLTYTGLGKAGKTFLYFGKASGWYMDTAHGKANASFLGENADDESGHSVAGAGDVNGDGYDDILIGAWGNSDTDTSAGKVYLIFGKASGWSQNVSLSNADVSFLGETKNDYAGCSVASAGDVNGDGFDDILIGAYKRDEGGSDSGQTYLILGRAWNWSKNIPLSESTASFTGEGSSNWAGYSVGGGGDINGDGYDDLLIGARLYDFQNGKTYIIFGKKAGWEMDISLKNSDASYYADNLYRDYSGTSVSCSGDVNGDGLDDIIIGSPGYDGWQNSRYGLTYVIFGKTSGWANDVKLNSADASYQGEKIGEQSGTSIASAGDVNGDGFDDIIIGSPENGESVNQAGKAHLVLGKSTGWGTKVSLSNADASFLGETKYAEAGFSVDGGGDINGDGYDDILIGAHKDTELSSNGGQAYLVFPESNSRPSSITSVKVYSDDKCTAEINFANITDTIYVELRGTDSNANKKDIAIVTVKSNVSSQLGFRLRLIETGNNTGVYRGSFRIESRTHGSYHWIKAFYGEHITITSVRDTVKSAQVNVTADFGLLPELENVTVKERNLYLERVYSTWLEVDWSVETNASWLSWNETYQVLTGIPGDSDVGECFVRINATNAFSESVEYNYTITVKNVPPKITNYNLLSVDEDSYYSVFYESTDDGQVWSWSSNATWLSFNATTRILNGTPRNADVGRFWVSIRVNDSHGEFGYSNFTVYVDNVKPTFTLPHLKITYEDQLYYYDVNTDDEPSVSYTLETSADFLSFDTKTGIISGIPDNSDVGGWSILIRVYDNHSSDNYNLTSFTLTVKNVLPNITSSDLTTATERSLYLNDYNSTDDPTTWWKVVSTADFLFINMNSGLLYGTPDNGDIGTFSVNVSVNDYNGGINFTTFNLTVTNLPPEIITVGVTEVEEFVEYYYDCNSTDDGGGNISWTVITNAHFLYANQTSGVVNGTPGLTDTGIYWINLTVNDGNGETDSQNFTITVLNHNPEIITADVVAIEENQVYRVDYNSSDDGVINILWQMTTNADWLSFNQSTGVLNGTPDYFSAGSYWVNVSVTDGFGGLDFRNFSILVINDIPKIITPNVSPVTEELDYYVDYDSDDDNKTVITWSLKTNGNWLDINTTTGELFGQPTNNDVGSCWVNITATNSLGDMGFTNFTLIVINTNDPPQITTLNVLTVFEDAYYEVIYSASDIDAGDVMQWSLNTNASWLSMGSLNGTLYGTPRNTDIGSFWVSVNVTDGNGGYDENNFNLIVYGINDPPIIQTEDKTTCFEDEYYEKSYTAVDEDIGDFITWSFSTSANWLYWGFGNQTLYGTPGNSHVGYFWVNITVNDLKGSTDVHNFSLEVINKNDAPELKTFFIRTAYEDELYELTLNAVDPDNNDELFWTVETPADWLKFSKTTLILSGTPDNNDVGEYDVKIRVEDIAGEYDERTFKLTVENINDPPEFIDPPGEITVLALEEATLDLSAYISDIDNPLSELSLIVESEYVDAEGFKLIFSYPISIKADDVEVTIDDGTDLSAPHIIKVTVKTDHIKIPEVVDHSPDGKNVPVDTMIVITFNKLMDHQSLNDSFFISPSIKGEFQWKDNTLTFIPGSELLYNQTYTVIMDSSAKDTEEFYLEDLFRWQFTTIRYDTDGDGLPDDGDKDDDNDGYPDEWEVYMGRDPKDPLDSLTDTDGDGIPDGDLSNTKTWMDLDDDNDNLTDEKEDELNTNPQKKDTDEDGYTDDIDDYPLDSSKWTEDDDEPIAGSREPEDKSNTALLISAVVIIAVVAFILIFLFVLRPKMAKRSEEEKKE